MKPIRPMTTGQSSYNGGAKSPARNGIRITVRKMLPMSMAMSPVSRQPSHRTNPLTVPIHSLITPRMPIRWPSISACNSTIVISSNLSTFIIDSNTGEIITKKNFSASVRPIIQNNYVFLITEENLLISINLINGDIIYSYDINEQIAQFLKIKKDTAHFKSLMFANNKILTMT